MSDKSQVLCKYHVAGVCRFGSECAFSHNLAELPNQVCKYYLAGCCAYGDRCRYDHKRPEYWKAKQQQQQQRSPQPERGIPATSGAAGAGSTGGGSAGSSNSTGRPSAIHRMTRATDPWDSPHPHAPASALSPAGGLQAGRSAAAAGVKHTSTGTSSLQATARSFVSAVGGTGGTTASGGGQTAAGASGSAEQPGVRQSWEQLGLAESRGMWADIVEDEEAHAGDAVEYGDDDGYGYEEDGGEDYYDTYIPGDAAAADDADAGEPGDAMAYDCAGDGGDGGDGNGLTMVDDDIGLLAEEQAVAQRGRAVPGDPLGGAAAVATADGGSRWAADRHPWEAAGGAAEGGRGVAAEAEAAGPSDPVDPGELDLCPHYALHGRCAEGDDCVLVHGLECEICHKFRIHPYNAESAAEHTATCRLRHERLEARLRSSGVECGICLEPVLSKPSVTDRRFGLMACDHAFCLPCIRSWRERTTDTSLATDTAVRTCPVCRTPTHFVTPSLVWPASAEEKTAILAAYKAKLASIDCRHFDFGNGTCPFSTSCFYRHMHRDGRMEEPALRRAGDADGGVRVVMPVRLSAFFELPQAQRLLGRRR